MQQRERSRRSVHHAAQARELFQRSNSQAHCDPLTREALDALAFVLEALQTTEEELALAHERQLDGYALLQAEHQTYQDLFVHAPFAYLTTRLDGTIRRANQAAEQIFADEAKLIGRQLADLLPAAYHREYAHLLQRLGGANATERLTTTQWIIEGTSICNSLGRPHEIRWVASPAAAAPEAAVAPKAVEAEGAVCAHARCFAAALDVLQRTPDGTAAGLQLAHLLTAAWADLVILERSASGERERIIGVRGAHEQRDICVVRQRAETTTGDELPPVGVVTIADAAMFRTLGLFTELEAWNTARLPLRGYHAAARCNGCEWRLICLHDAAQGDYSGAQRAMLEVLAERLPDA